LPIALTQEQQALQASLRDWAKRAGTIAAIRAGQDVTLSAERVAIGSAPAQAVTEGTERAGYHLASGHAVALLGERGAHPAIRKLLGTAHRQDAAESALEHLGPAGAAETEASQEFLLTRCLSIAGGTTQILLTQVAERVLGLPR
jgi:3-oxochol-4-en-24-oyl-CoA dehydrogenase